MMERSLLGVLYFSGWLQLSTCLLQQYHFVADEMTWTEAQTYCRQKHTDLATIENNDEMNQLINTVSSAGHNSEVWIGLYSEIDWKWSDGFNGTGAQYRNWQPTISHLNFKFDCVMIYRQSWQGYHCSSTHPFICYKGTQLDPEFVFVETSMTWSNAQRYCRENFIDLANVRNDTEQQKAQTLSGTTWTWIGLFSSSSVHWSDGSGYGFTNWRTATRPFPSTVTCGVAVLQDYGQWSLKFCETRLPFVCYGDPSRVERKVVKLMLKPEDSVDLNDPAVKADLLKKLQVKLEEKGVSGVTLKWREQPDGEVFRKERTRSQKNRRQKTEL
ncbi:secretory phospholipase A2 receptor-like [Embiotoca jacksoni]|uniref:secretory phospholipase A2 receptor-like n=1 Tax=Embiotoca jacksoni TaxID=100190 RepID=UPI0037047376